MKTEYVNVTKPAEMIGSLWVWLEDGVLYRCESYDEYGGTYTFKGFVDEEKSMTCLYSFLSVKMALIRGA